jgi:hypothetical protein
MPGFVFSPDIPWSPTLGLAVAAWALEFLAAKIYKQIPGLPLLLLPIGGHLTLATAVLSALFLFAMSILPLPKGVLAKMDRSCLALVWKSTTACSGGDCRVVWDFFLSSSGGGGLGMVDSSL